MASKELIEELAEDLFQADRGEDAKKLYYAKEHYENMARIAISTILAALKEPTGEMKKVWDDDMSDWIDERIEDPYHPWVIMLNASPLGEKSE